MKQLLFTILSMVVFNTQASHARLSALSVENTIKIDGQSYDQVFASCGTKDQKPMLIRKQGENLCHTNKLEVGQRVCSLSYSKRLKALNSDDNKAAVNQSGGVVDLRKEAMEIKAALIDIQATRVALLQRELELRKQRDSRLLQASR